MARQKQRRIVVSAIIFNEGRILLIQRHPSDKMNPSKWEIPGGKVRFGESPRIAVKREVREETGLVIQILYPLDVSSHISKMKSRIRQTIQITYMSRSFGSIVRLNLREHVRHRWIAKKDVKNLNLVKGTPEILIKAFNANSK